MKIQTMQTIYCKGEVEVTFPAYSKDGHSISRTTANGYRVSVHRSYMFADKWNTSVSYELIELDDVIRNPDYLFGLRNYRATEAEFYEALDAAIAQLTKERENV